MSRSPGRPWPERAETDGVPATLTVLGVDRGDHGLPAQLDRAVPVDADALCLDRPRNPLTRRERFLTCLGNPGVLFLGIASTLAVCSGYLSYGTTRREFDRKAVEAVARSREIPVERVGRSPLAASESQSLWWHLAGWAVTLCVLAAAMMGVLVPGLGAVLFLVAAVALASAYVLAYVGVTIDAERTRLFDTIQRVATESSYDHPVAVVRRRHVPGVTDRAKDARVRTRDRIVSPATDVDWADR